MNIVNLSVRKKEEIILGNVGNQDYSPGDRVIVEIDKTLEIAKVISKEYIVKKTNEPIFKILRKILPEDEKIINENQQKEKEILKTVMRKIKENDLDMKLISLEYSYDRTKLYIYYTSETRVDFRSFIKELGYILKTHIQMVQIGIRDAAKILGGFGHCGRLLCCMTFLKEFSSISMNMAKQQEISSNVSKMFGLCGRLMCCLAFESEFYEEMRKKIPQIGTKVQTPDGPGIITAVNCLTQEVVVELQNKQIKKFKNEEINVSFLEKITHEVVEKLKI